MGVSGADRSEHEFGVVNVVQHFHFGMANHKSTSGWSLIELVAQCGFDNATIKGPKMQLGILAAYVKTFVITQQYLRL